MSVEFQGSSGVALWPHLVVGAVDHPAWQRGSEGFFFSFFRFSLVNAVCAV